MPLIGHSSEWWEKVLGSEHGFSLYSLSTAASNPAMADLVPPTRGTAVDLDFESDGTALTVMCDPVGMQQSSKE